MGYEGDAGDEIDVQYCDQCKEATKKVHQVDNLILCELCWQLQPLDLLLVRGDDCET